MTRYLANGSLLFAELPLPRRPAAAREAGFTAIEFWWPFASPVPVFGHARPGTLVIDFSTIRPDVAAELAAEGAERGFRVLDAPVSGGEQGAKRRGAVHHGRRYGRGLRRRRPRSSTRSAGPWCTSARPAPARP
jgi:hydroxypyruvate isomerase